MGAGNCADDVARTAYEVGRRIAEAGAVLVCGGRGGVMEAAARGAREAGGLVVGILPGRNDLESPPNPFVDVAVFTGMAEGRNWVNVCTSDAVIALPGGYGTLSEIALAMKIGRPVVVIGDTAEIAPHGGPRPRAATTAEEAVAIALGSIGS